MTIELRRFLFRLRSTVRPGARGFVWIDDLRRDVLYACRTVRRFPAFSATVLLTLAIGIGANTAIFSAVYAVLLAPLPHSNPDRLVRVWENVPGREIGDGKGPGRRYPAMDIRDMAEIAATSKTTSLVANYGPVQSIVTFGSDSTRVEGTSTSGDLLPLLGVRPLIGRAITSEDAVAGRDHVVVLSYELWERFGRPDIAGRAVSFAGDPNGPFSGGIVMGAPYAIVGVMPQGFRFPSTTTRFWIPRVQRLAPDARPVRRETIARLSSGATAESAAAEFAAIRSNVRGSTSAIGRPRYELIRLHDELTRPVRAALLVLTGAVAIVLLIACVNVANLQLARGLARRRELAVRMAIGAGRARLIRQLLTESLVLALIGGTAGIGLAYAGAALFRTLGTTLGRSDLGNAVVFPRLADVQIDAAVVGYAAVVTVITGALFGVLPTLRHSHLSVVDALKDQATSHRLGVKRVLIAIEVGLATVLLVAGGLLIGSFVRLASVDPGFEPSHLLSFQVGVARGGDELAFAETLVDRFRHIPQVMSAAYARQLPMVDLKDALRLTLRRNGTEITVDDSPDVRFVGHDYLQALGVPVLAGRGLTEQDGAGQPPVIVVNDALARRDFKGSNPIGQTILLGPPTHRLAFEVVGVVGNVRQFGLDRPPESQYFIDMRQVPADPAFRMPPLFAVGAYYIVRTTRDPVAVVADIREAVREVDPLAPVDRVATIEQILSNSTTRPRMYAVLIGIFSLIAVTLSGIGLAGVVTYNVAQRTREIGIRMALGARRREVLTLVMGDNAAVIAVGLAGGLVAAALTTRYMSELLYGLTPLDPTTFVSVAIVLIGAALLASYLPARRATAIDPLVALRTE